MFRKMRRFKQEISQEETIAILEQGTSGVLALSGDEGYPYAVPISYVYSDGKLYFHCAKQGHKLDAIARCDKASFCVIQQDQVVPEEYTTYFRSAIAFGRARVLTDDAEKRHALEILAAKYSPDLPEGRAKEIESGWKAVCLVELAVEHMTGKISIELVRQAQQKS